MNIAGMIAIGNGERCPYCDIVLEKDVSQHLLDHHAEQVMEHLFDEEEYYKVKQDLIDEKIQQQEDDYREGVIGPGAEKNK